MTAGKKGGKKSSAGTKRKGKAASKEVEQADEQKGLGDDYWDRVADDVAAGYKSGEDEDKVLNKNQVSDDQEKNDLLAE